MIIINLTHLDRTRAAIGENEAEGAALRMEGNFLELNNRRLLPLDRSD